MSPQSPAKREGGKTGIRILVADPNAMYRDALECLLGREEGLQLVGLASTGKEALEMARRLRPDVLLLDMMTANPSALETLRRLQNSSSPVRTIVFANKSENSRILEALKLGACGVVHRHAALDLLFKGIRAVAAGDYWVGHENICDLVNCVRTADAPAVSPKAGRSAGLTPRELDIVNSVVDGRTNKDIAQMLSISEQTVKHHLTRIFEKTGVANRLELALQAMQGSLQ